MIFQGMTPCPRQPLARKNICKDRSWFETTAVQIQRGHSDEENEVSEEILASAFDMIAAAFYVAAAARACTLCFVSTVTGSFFPVSTANIAATVSIVLMAAVEMACARSSTCTFCCVSLVGAFGDAGVLS